MIKVFLKKINNVIYLKKEVVLLYIFAILQVSESEDEPGIRWLLIIIGSVLDKMVLVA